MDRLKIMIKNMFREELDIQHKLLNLILSAAFAGGIISLLISIAIGFDAGAVLIVVLIVLVVGISLWIANIMNKPQVAALLLVITANMVIFPMMYFMNGGMNSGMPVWLVLGMIFSWLILKGSTCIAIYIINAVVVVCCILLEMKHPEMVYVMESRTARYFDLIQSMIIVTCIFGSIFKYQTYVYEKQKKQILEANQVKSDFLANMSHEVRTPINAILGYNEMIMKESRESHTAEHALNVQSAGRTLLSLVNSILEFTNIDKGELVLKSEPYAISEILQDLATYAQYNAEKKGLELCFSVDESIPQVLLGDAIRLTQIVDNLISNAIKYTKEGSVEISFCWDKKTQNQGVLKVQVKDAGIGMRKEDVKKISESFIRFDNEQTRNIQGVGLGLTIATRLLDLMNSKLQVESEFGKGSIFSFELLQEVVENTPIGKFENDKSYGLSGLKEVNFEASGARVLVVDDNAMNLDLLRGMLTKTKMQIDTAVNGEEALELVRKNEYHVILMDHMMPVMDGVEALEKMQEEGLCEDTPIIVLTANAVGNAKEKYLKVGFADYLSKPVYSSQLLEMIKKYLPEKLCSKKQTSESLAENTSESFLDKVRFLETNIGMQYCCDSEEFYREMLGSYLSNSKYDVLNQSYKEGNWEDYRISVHALKSTSLSIGAVKLSEDAKQLEMAVKEDRIDYIKENHDGLMISYKELLEQLTKALEEKSDIAEECSDNITSEKEHILVVDDDSMNLRIAEKLLGDSFQVDCVKSGQEALQFLDDATPNLILLDLHMPEMDGFEVIKRIKENDKQKEIPVIFLTADNDRDVEVKGFREGALDFITKPFIADIMLQRVKRILELDRLQKNLQKEVEKQTRSAEARREKVERLSLQITLTLANTIDAKDKYTNGHSLRVAEYAKEIARRIGKSKEEQEDVYYAGLLHDIGKIGIPNKIINKTSGLTDEEYALIKRHTQIGAEILENMAEIPVLSVGAHWHHEMYNGKGYPDGLSGEEIPEIARIIGVADAYDAMASKRSYRDVLPQKIVREEILRGRGIQFDPKFTDVMLAMIDEDTEYQMKEQSLD